MISRKNEHIESLKQQFLDYESTFSYLPEETGKKLIELREKNEFTQNEVADIIGIARNTLSNYEKGKRSLDIITLRKLCKLYNVPRIIYLVLKVPLQVIMIFNQMMLYVALAFLKI